MQGELPFQYWDKTDMVFADLRTDDGDFATIDYSEKPPLLFLGRAVEFDDLHLKNLREFEDWSRRRQTKLWRAPTAAGRSSCAASPIP